MVAAVAAAVVPAGMVAELTAGRFAGEVLDTAAVVV
jgi:ribosomal protein L14E/L6E/L27E